ncbi:MAG: hypothetical protein ACFCUU_09375 [Cyclobacteriaceae bacterium]
MSNRKLIFLLGICLLPIAAFAQTFTLTIQLENLTINGKAMKTDEAVVVEIDDLQLQKSIILYNDDDFTYGIYVRINRSGNRLKIKHHSIVTKHNNILYGKSKKHVQFLHTSMPGNFDFARKDNFVLDRMSFSSLSSFIKVNLQYN